LKVKTTSCRTAKFIISASTSDFNLIYASLTQYGPVCYKGASNVVCQTYNHHLKEVYMTALVNGKSSLLSAVLSAVLTLIMACACQTEKSENPADPHNPAAIAKTAMGSGILYFDEAISGEFQGLATKNASSLPNVLQALNGSSESDLLKAMKADNVTLLALPTRNKSKSGSIYHKCTYAGELDLFSVIYVDEDMTLIAPTHSAYVFDPDKAFAVFSYIRASLIKSSDKHPLSDDLAAKTPGETVIDLRFTSEEGFNKEIGRIRARGSSVAEAIDAAIKKASERYAAWGGGMNVESIQEYLNHARMTLTIFRERGYLAENNRGFLNQQINIGLDGLVIALKDGNTVILTPDKSKLLREEDLTRMIELELRNQKIANKDVWKEKDTELYKFRVVEYTEKQPNGEAVKLFRGVEYVPYSAMTKEEIDRGFRDGAEWLLSIFDPASGMFKYTYWAVADRYQTNQYNLIRHGLATLTLIQAFELYGDERFLNAAQKAIEYIWTLTEYEGKLAMFRHPKYDPGYKLGGAGVILQAACQFNRHKRMTEWDRQLKGLAEFIMVLQEKNGHYKSFYTKPGQKEENKEITIYPGEANLALVYMYNLFGDKRYLETVKKAVNSYYRKWFNDKKNPRGKGSLGAYIPWEMTAMGEYWKVTKEDFAAEFAYEMANWVVDNWFAVYPDNVWYKDFEGAIMNAQSPYMTPPWNSGVYGEGLISVWEIAKLRGDKDMQKKLQKVVLGNARFTRNLQYRDVSSYYLPNPSRARGCIPSSFHKDDCRLDFAYHCLTVDFRIIKWFDEEDYKL